MEIQSHSLKVERTARYFKIGSAGKEKTTVWFVLHGYGQLASFFLRNFEPLAGEGSLVVAPEGLSRYYLDPQYGRVGASWMTKEDRQSEIDDYVAYLDKLHDLILAPLQGQQVSVNLLGFSQGVPTAWRWAKHGNIHADELVFWAGMAPEENPDELSRRLVRTRVWFAWADEDEFITQEMAQVSRKNVHALNTLVEDLPYAGTHRIERDALDELMRRMR
jgi:dienelactone hydrolase